MVPVVPVNHCIALYRPSYRLLEAPGAIRPQLCTQPALSSRHYLPQLCPQPHTNQSVEDRLTETVSDGAVSGLCVLDFYAGLSPRCGVPFYLGCAQSLNPISRSLFQTQNLDNLMIQICTNFSDTNTNTNACNVNTETTTLAVPQRLTRIRQILFQTAP